MKELITIVLATACTTIGFWKGSDQDYPSVTFKEYGFMAFGALIGMIGWGVCGLYTGGDSMKSLLLA